MALPTLEKTWSFWVNQAFTNASIPTQNVNAWLALNAHLVANVPGFSIAGSGDAAVGAMDAVNRWIDAGDILQANPGSPHSWLCWQFANIGNMQILFDHVSFGANKDFFTVYMSLAGFTGGSSTARPTATDEVPLGAGQYVMNNNVGNIVHCMHSTDGQQIKLFTTDASGIQVFGTTLGVIADATPGWPTPYYIALQGHNAIETFTLTYLYTSTANVAALNGANDLQCSLTIPGAANSTLVQLMAFPNEISGEWPMMQMGLYAHSGIGRGHHGRVVDQWWGAAQRVTGDTYPGDSSRQFAQFGDVIIPWDGSVPVI